MRKRKDLEEDGKWRRIRKRIRWEQEKARKLRHDPPNNKPRKRIQRRGHFSVDPLSSYWNFGAMKHVCQFCSAIHFLGERNRQVGSTLSSPKFIEYCSNGQVTLHYLMRFSCSKCSAMFQASEGHLRQMKSGESCSSCGHVVPKILPTFFDPTFLLRQLLTSNSADSNRFRN